MYKFTTTPIENNNDEINGKWYKMTRASKENPDKFRSKQQNERASLFMQFLVLFNRYFKASIRNTVSSCWNKYTEKFHFQMKSFMETLLFVILFRSWYVLESWCMLLSRLCLVICITMLATMRRIHSAIMSTYTVRFYWLSTRGKWRLFCHVSSVTSKIG